ncbi:hypothetical protein AVEN_31388-1 [Araneus ventricosus]|uniref:Tc1-like transposase DDE domain-containing protein n=1 Tax=Araneus ventricosus TaxID=182803 RepID=A0A4Y2F8G3_ARAVE|nr:hypothetical protein AVEN_31388-1 [Araneus ventricosus]
MDWPAYSPDLNPIEHVWNMLGRRIAARQPPPTCLPELRRALLEEWCNIPQDQIDNLILSMPRRFLSAQEADSRYVWTPRNVRRVDCHLHARRRESTECRVLYQVYWCIVVSERSVYEKLHYNL